MKTSSTWIFRFIVGKIIVGLVLITMIGSIDVAPAIARDDRDRNERHDNGRYEERGRRSDRDRYERDRRDYKYYRHRERVYVPPRVIYEPPPPPPGISIFFPPIIIRP